MKLIRVLESTLFSAQGGTVEFLEDGDFKSFPVEKGSKVKEFPYPYLNPIQSVFFWKYQGGNALISSPTSSGKTLITLLFRKKNPHGRLIYTAPTRSLIYEKHKEFKKLFGKIGLRTGDLVEELSEIKEKTIVSTYESLVSAARNKSQWFEEAEAVVIDEIHIVKDPTRGAGIEEIVSYCLKENKSLLCLSATIPGAKELADWINASILIESEWRPVPLERTVINFSKLLRKVKGAKSTPAEKTVSAVEHLNLKGKTIVFVPKKDLGWEALKVENDVYGKKVLNETTPFKTRKKGKGKVAFHNADVPYQEREKIETSFKEKDLNRLYATQTLAYGINLPADNVVVFVRGSFDRFTHQYRFFPDLLTILQMEGRAGRFGLSEKGNSYIIVSGSKEETLLKALNEELNSPFQTALSQGLKERSRVACPNKTKSILSLMVLGPMIRYGKHWKEAVKNTFSLKKNPLLLFQIEKIIEELTQMGYIKDEKPTPLCSLLASSYVSPYCFEEFKNRLSLTKNIKEHEKTHLYAFALRPLIKREFNPSTLNLFTQKAFTAAQKQLNLWFSRRFNIKIEDNSDVLIFYVQGSLYHFSNIARPPGELSNLSSESSLLASFLCKINLLDFETVHRTAMMIRHGIPFNYSLLGTIEGLGYMRGNALAIAAELCHFHNEIPLINSIKEERKETIEALNEALSIRFHSLKQLKKELNTIVKIVKEAKFPLGNDKLLRFLSSIFVGREKALKLSKEEALEVLFENVKGKKENQA